MATSVLAAWRELPISVPDQVPPALNCYQTCLKEWKIASLTGYHFLPLNCANICEQRTSRGFLSESQQEQQAYIRRVGKDYSPRLDGDPQEMARMEVRVNEFYEKIEEQGGLYKRVFGEINGAVGRDGGITWQEFV
jgi:tetrahydromethanopterin S-methyltransferase subunit G